MRIRFDKSNSFLFIIILLIAGISVFFLINFQTDEISSAIKDDRIIKILFVIESEGKPISTQILFHYPVTRRSAVFDIPEETGQLLKSVQRMARIDSLYSSGNVNPFRQEIERLTGTEVPWYIVMDISGFTKTVDLLEGLDIFIPNAVDIKQNDVSILLPSGAVTLDGEKSVVFATFRDPAEPEIEMIARKQKTFQALLKKLGEKSLLLTRKEVFPLFKGLLNTNLSDPALTKILIEFANINVEHIVPQRVSGNRKDLDGITVLFPYYNGELLKDIVKQTLNAIGNMGNLGTESRIYTVEILNGTSSKGLAKKTAELFQSFGYDVLSVGNADSFDIEKTSIIDRQANPEIAKDFAKVIKCDNLESGISTNQQDITIDFTVVLGKDFNGRYITR